MYIQSWPVVVKNHHSEFNNDPEPAEKILFLCVPPPGNMRIHQ